MKPIKLSPGICLAKTRKNAQNCIVCGQPMGTGTVGIMFQNYRDELTLKKNLWMHIGCRQKLCNVLTKGIEKNKEEITLEGVV